MKTRLKFDPIRRAVLVATLAFLFCIIFALPKVYTFSIIQPGVRPLDNRVSYSTRICVMPIWGQKPGGFKGLNLSVLLCEFLASTALGLLVWVFSGKTTVPIPEEEKNDSTNCRVDQPDKHSKDQ